MQNYRQEVAQEFIDAIEAGTAPWQKPWNAGEATKPVNGLTGQPYKGINSLRLDLLAATRGYEDPRWMTFAQSTELGGRVRKGERSTTIEFWQFTKMIPVLDENKQPVLDENGLEQKRLIKLERPDVFYAQVFNGSQIDGLSKYQHPAITWEPNERVEAIIASMPDVKLTHGGDSAFYSPSDHAVRMPDKAAFQDDYGYYATLLHEYGHATGHKTLLAREIGPYGSELYAKEELRAEIASYMAARELGIAHDPSRHAGYVESWLKVLKDDPNEIFRAARDADKIVLYLTVDQLRPQLIEEAQNRQKADERVKEEVKAMNDPNRIFLDVKAYDVEARRIVKAAGAKFDNLNKVWYISEPNDALAKWIKPKEEIAKTLQNRERVYLYVPIPEKDEAKALGAKWDGLKRQWYVHEFTDDFKRWQNPPPEVAKSASWQTAANQVTPVDQQANFAAFLREQGAVLPTPPVMDGKWHRVGLEGDKPNSQNASYRGFSDGLPNGQLQNYKTGETLAWSAQNYKPLSPEERQRAMETAQAQRLANEQAIAKAKADAVRTAYGVWEHAKPAEIIHPYLQAKGVNAHGLRQTEDGKLIVPLQNTEGKLRNLQFISEDGEKRFLKGGEKLGNFHLIGKIEPDKPIIIAEGYATAASIYEATGRPVAVAFDASNLYHVGAALRGQHANEIIFAADQDVKKSRETGINTGVSKAEEAAKEIYASRVLVPTFSHDQIEKGNTDWNDFVKERGPLMLANVFNKQLSYQVNYENRPYPETVIGKPPQAETKSNNKTLYDKIFHPSKLGSGEEIVEGSNGQIIATDNVTGLGALFGEKSAAEQIRQKREREVKAKEREHVMSM